MPQSSYRALVGVAKDATNTTVAAAVTAGATTVTVASATGITAGTSSIIIFDGSNTETRAVTLVSTNTLTVAALTNSHAAGCYVVVQPTASVGPTDYIPVNTIDFEDKYDTLFDNGQRGSLVDRYNAVQGVGWSEINVGGDAFADTLGYALGGVLGATDFTGGSPNTHAFSVKNTADGQPTAQVLYLSDGITTRAFSRCRWQEVALKFSPSGLLTWDGKATANRSGVVSAPTPSFSTIPPVAAWTCTTSVAGTNVGILAEGDLTIKREVVHPSTLQGIQDPYTVFLGKTLVDGKLTLIMEDETQLNAFLGATQQSFLLTFSQGTNQIILQLTKGIYTTGKRSYGKAHIELPVTLAGVANTTDATTAGTGYSPIKASLKNTKATGTYL